MIMMLTGFIDLFIFYTYLLCYNNIMKEKFEAHHATLDSNLGRLVYNFKYYVYNCTNK